MRPRTLREVAQLAALEYSFDQCLANFLDDFYSRPTTEALVDMPPLLGPLKGETGRIQDAYLAATAEELCCKYRLLLPVWTSAAERRLSRPWFALPWASVRAVLLWESPPGFRSRNLFVSENALSRV
ncbi:MAG: hypothetical protein FJ405_10015 [Verrucomicrobia bacterium]|nr:hypothetical protein [Verrucomicrobiota bacterium]